MERLKFNQQIPIDTKYISDEGRTFIIAEAGVNHNGNLVTAKKMVDEACFAGVDAIKFQSFKTEKLILRDAEKAPYQKETTSEKETQYEMLKKLEMSIHAMEELKAYCNKKKIIFLSTPFEESSLSELVELDVPAIKVAATDLTNIKFLRQIAKTKKTMIISAGMCYLEEVKVALEAIFPFNKNVILLQCTANYPIQDEEANLSVIKTLKREFDILVGYSDHSQGIGASPYAVACGAKVIEKHFTLDRNMIGPDHKASVLPSELKMLVEEIRTVEKYLGNGRRIPSVSEQGTRLALQKCLVAKTDVKCGELFTEDNVDAKRTNGKGISAFYYDAFVGKRSKKDYEENDILEVQ